PIAELAQMRLGGALRLGDGGRPVLMALAELEGAPEHVRAQALAELERSVSNEDLVPLLERVLERDDGTISEVARFQLLGRGHEPTLERTLERLSAVSEATVIKLARSIKQDIPGAEAALLKV